VNNELYCDFWVYSNGGACPTASLEPEVKLSTREPGPVREAEMPVAVVGESVNIQKTSVEGEMPLASASVSEGVHQPSTATAQHAGTVTAAALLPQSVPSASPSTSAESKGMWAHVNVPTVVFMSCFLKTL